MKKMAVSAIHKATVALNRLMGEMTHKYLEMGEILYHVRENRLYLEYASHIKTFSDYLNEIRMKHSTAYNCMNIFEKFNSVLPRKDPVDYERLVLALPLVKNASDAEAWADRAIELPRRAYDDAIREAKGKVTSDACTHPDVEVWVRCTACGKFMKDAPVVDNAAEG